MRKFIQTVVMASFAAIAMPASASLVQTDTTSPDSVVTTSTEAMNEKLAQMETRMTSMEKEQTQQKIWKRKRYWKFGIASPHLKRTDGEEMTWKPNGSFFIQQGRTIYFHAKPIAGMLKFGLNYGFFDFTYSKLKLKDITYDESTLTRASDGFDEIVSGEPNGNPSIIPGGIDLGMHKFDYSLHIGPSVSVNPWNHLIVSAYFHVMPTASGMLQNSNFSYGFGCMMSAGVSVSYKVISLGVEGLFGKIKYKQTDFSGGDDEEGDYDNGYDYGYNSSYYEDSNLDDDKGSYFNTEKFTLKQSGIRAYIAFRF